MRDYSLQWTLFCTAATLRCHWGRHKPSFHRAAGSLCPNLVLGQMYTELLLSAGHWRRPWEYSCEQAARVLHPREFTEMEIFLQSFGTS